MAKRGLSVLLTLALVLALMPAVAPHAHAEEHICVDGDYNHHCDTCRAYIECYDGEDDDPIGKRCDLCGACLTPVDENGDNWCDACVFCIEHTFNDAYWYQENGFHYPMCDNSKYSCSYYNYAEGTACTDTNGDLICDVCGNCIGEHSFGWDKEERYQDSHRLACSKCGADGGGESHFDSDEDGRCDACSTCMTHDDAAWVWDEATWDSEDHWMVCRICRVGYGWEGHSDSNEDKRCDTCNFNMGCPHETGEKQYDEVAHWSDCTICTETVYSKEAHSFDGRVYRGTFDRHYPECDSCNYYVEDKGEDHVDEDADDICDICEYEIHEHTFFEDYWYRENQYHYPECDMCDYYDETKGAACADEDGDHYCETCGAYMGWLCTDADGDHICDVCIEQLDLCKDDNGDHTCDTEACSRHMKEKCALVTEDGWICTVCKRNFCEHYFPQEPEPNYDGTHTRTCYYCGDVTEDCTHWHYDASLDTETTHTAFCRCGYRFPEAQHAYNWTARSMTGHTLRCDICKYEKREPHDFQNGVCTVCEREASVYCAVYVGGVGLTAGQYLDNAGNVSATQPAGGYAYYKEGILELNNYVYAGPGVTWAEYSGGEPDQASVYVTGDLTLVLTGENSLETLPEVEVEGKNFCDGIVAEGDLTVRGSGNLTVQGDDDGFQMESGNLTIESGNLTLDAGDYGFDVVGSVTVSGGTVTVTAGDDGFNVEKDIAISGGTISIDAKDYGLDSYNGSVNISGGSITIDAGYSGICGCKGTSTISGGELVVYGRIMNAITGGKGSVSITGGNLTLTAGASMVVFAETEINVENVELPAGVTVTADEYGQFIEMENRETLFIRMPFSATLENGSIRLEGRPWGLQILFASYNNEGKLIDLQLAEVTSDLVAVPTDGTYTAFFLNSRCAPVHETLPISE
ncbi:MAG: carbohydrate-binding domain-containing protein [Clostridia bacterium]|nr:carbohydrate-binding domain-containing protein [Clostridia bacterium]